MPNEHYTKTSEAVSIGHPDKVADQIADSVFDLLRTFKKDAQSAVEVACGANTLLIFGEIDKDIVHTHGGNGEAGSVERSNPSLAEKIRNVAQARIREIGYTEEEYNPEVILDIVVQSSEINEAVEESDNQEAAAGDQGIVSGYATNETTDFHELHFILSHRLLEALEEKRESGDLPFLLPDAKSQITVSYAEGKPVSIDHVLLSHSYTDDIDLAEVRHILSGVIVGVLSEWVCLLVEDDEIIADLLESLLEAEILINPAGAWHAGGPRSDSGLTGRKLVVDNYGSSAPIGGGATSGKNLNKVDRSGAYFARNIAKSIVAAGLADKALVELSFAIGVPEPTAINIETFGTERVSSETILERVRNAYDFRVSAMIELSAGLDKFVEASKHGNYTNADFPWEKVREL